MSIYYLYLFQDNNGKHLLFILPIASKHVKIHPYIHLSITCPGKGSRTARNLTREALFDMTFRAENCGFSYI